MGKSMKVFTFFLSFLYMAVLNSLKLFIHCNVSAVNFLPFSFFVESLFAIEPSEESIVLFWPHERRTAAISSRNFDIFYVRFKLLLTEWVFLQRRKSWFN